MGLELFMMILLMTLRWSLQQDICLEVEKISVCSRNSSTWAYDTPYINITHRVSVTVAPLFALTYYLTLEDSNPFILCTYQFNSDGTCENVQGSFCIEDGCTNYYSVNGTVVSKFSITGLDGTKNQSLLAYTVARAGLNNQFLQRLLISECSTTVGDATATSRSGNPCGYGCTSRFNCYDGYEFQSPSSQSTTYQCEADAKWNINETLCIPKVTTTATMLVTTTDKDTPDPEKLVECSKAAFTITSVGCILTVIFAVTVACTMKKVWRFKKEPAAKMFYLGFVAAAAACVLAIGLLFGSTACVAAIIIGAIGSCGMLLVTGLYAREAMKTKGIQGKKIEAAAEL